MLVAKNPNMLLLLPNLAVRIAAAILSVPPESIALCLPMIAPPPTSPQQFQQRQAIDHALQKYWNEEDGYNAPLEEQTDIDAMYTTLGGTDKRPSTYGEITPLGARQLFSCMNMYGSDERRDIVFFDLGSGAGRLVAQSYLELPRMRRSVGVEFSTARHEAALAGWGKICDDGQVEHIHDIAFGRKSQSPSRDTYCVEFCNSDLFAKDISEATHLYASSLCFTEEMMEDLATKLETGGPNLKSVATLQMFPVPLFGISHPVQEWIEMSWTKARGEGCPVYFYHRVNNS